MRRRRGRRAAGATTFRAVPLRETTFITRNVDTWRRLEDELDRPAPDPDVLRDLYGSVTDDLSYARTHYPNRSVRSYLNYKTAALSLSLYRNERSGTGFARFWTQTVPLELYLQRDTLAVALGLFALTFAIGWASATVDPDFATSILGQRYVDMTEDNIAAGDPMAVYKDGSRLGGALGIAGNNLYVSMLCFVGGILLGLGTLVVLLQNGVMVGAFQQFFFARGVGWESVLGIWTHGTIEISCIIVAAGAGLVLAKGLIWPGTLSRSRAFQLTALSGLRIMAAIAPLIVLAAIIEGYLTRLTDIPTPLRVGFLLLNLAFVIYYLVLRPRQVGRHVAREATDFGRLPPERPLDWREFAERGAARSFFESVRYFVGPGSGALLRGLVAGALAGVAYFFLAGDDPHEAPYYDANGAGADVTGWMGGLAPPSLALAVLFCATVMPWLTLRLHRALPGGRYFDRGEGGGAIAWRAFVALGLGWCVLFALAYVHVLLAVIALPLAALWMRGVTYRHGGEGRAVREAFAFGMGGFGPLALASVMTAVAYLVVGLAYEGLAGYFVVRFIESNVPPSWDDHLAVTNLIAVVFDTAYLVGVSLFIALAFGLLYHSLRERATAEGLRRDLEETLPA